MSLDQSAILMLAKVCRLIGKLDLKDELTEVTEITGEKRQVVQQYLNGELPIPTQFETKLYNNYLQLKRKKKEPQTFDGPFTPIPANHPILGRVKWLEDQLSYLAKFEKDMLHQLSKAEERTRELEGQLRRTESKQMKDPNDPFNKYLKELKRHNRHEKRDKTKWLDDLEDRIESTTDPINN